MKIGYLLGRSGQGTKVVVAINTGVVAVVPMDADGVITDSFD